MATPSSLAAELTRRGYTCLIATTTLGISCTIAADANGNKPDLSDIVEPFDDDIDPPEFHWIAGRMACSAPSDLGDSELANRIEKTIIT